MDPVYVKLALGGLALMGSIGLFFGIGLALAAHKFAVEVNPKVEAVLDVLPGANCGACSYAGCEAYAEAVVNDPKVPPNMCPPGMIPVAEAVAQITGKELEIVEGAIAMVSCARSERHNYEKYQYSGYQNCAAANLTFAGPVDCSSGCIGFGDCAEACLFDALKIENDFPVVDPDACVGCALCVNACPKDLIQMIPKKAPVVVKCACKDTSKETMSVCSLGCLHCLACIEACPAKAISLIDGKLTIDHEKCIEHGPSCNEACINACWINYPASSDIGNDIYQRGLQFFQRPLCRNPFYDPRPSVTETSEQS
jgi:electron transport complex protein RnfB